MRAWSRAARLLGVLLLLAGMISLPGAAPVRAAGTGASITLHVFWCADPGRDIFVSCHDWDTTAIDGAEYRVAGATRWTTDGYVTWKPRAGTYTIRGASISGFAGAYVFCSNQVTHMILYADGAPTDQVTITTTAGQEVICDWYYLL